MRNFRLYRNDEGSILVSAILFVAISSIFLAGLATIIHRQVTQLTQIQHTYEAKSMILMTEHLLNEQRNNNESLKSGTIIFENGKTEWKIEAVDYYIIEATLENQYTLSKKIDLSDTNE